jgi:peptidoglycan hydrolase CwlO-like protein
MTAELKAQANELDTHTKELRVKGTSLEERTKQLEGVTGEINPQVKALHDITANLTFQSDALKTTIENLGKKFGELYAASNELNTRAIKLENKSVSQASRLGALGLQIGKHISRSHKIFWVLAIAVALWPVAAAWLHLNYTKRLETQLPKGNLILETLTGRLNEADQARNKLQAQLIQTQAQLTQTSDELKSFRQQPNRLNTSIEQLEQRIDALEQKSSSREDVGRFWPTLHSANWLLTQPAEYYTLQLLTAINKAWLVDFIRRHPLPPDSAHFRITNRGWRRYMVVTGVYESARSASQAIKALPQPWQRYNPWIRKIGGIQQNILAQLDG